ncbi:MAG: protein kinase [Steroidobacteraceae bacterium]
MSIDKESGESGESPRVVLSGWLNDYSAGRCDRADMQTSFLDICKSNPEAPWDALALLDQYQRRGRIDAALARSLKSDIAQLVFGASNQTEGPREPPPKSENASNTTGSGWRKQSPPDRSVAPLRRPEVVSDPTLFRRDFDPPTRPPPRVQEPVAEKPAPEPAPPSDSSANVAANVAPEPAAPGMVLRDRYELLEVIGKGKVGTVYKAFDRHRSHLPGPARYVAVKVLKSKYKDRPEAIAELERESYEAQSLSHPNIVSVFDLDRHADTYFIVMELLEGELLSSVLRWLDGRPLVRNRALGIIATIGGALVHAHQRNIVHADLKPANVMITSSGELKLLDFGFARRHALEPWISEGGSDESAPSSTPAYASSERVNGEEPHLSDDVYSLACIAYELLTGVHPFGGRSAPLARAHGRDPARIPGLANKQWYAMQNALSWTRSERRIDVAELVAALGCGQPGQRVGSPQELIAAAGKSAGGSKFGVVMFGALVTLAVVAAIAWGQFKDLIGPRLGIPVTEVEEPAPAAPALVPLTRSTPPVETGIRESEPSSSTVTAPVTTPPAVQQVPEPPPEQATKPSRAPAATNAVKPATAPAAAAAAEADASSAAAALGTVEFEKDTYVATESDGTVRITVKRTGSVKRAAKFRWTLHSNSAEAGADFANIGPDVEEMPAGARTAVLTIPLVSDGLVENTELFLVELSQVEGGPAVGEQARAAVILVDDD